MKTHRAALITSRVIPVLASLCLAVLGPFGEVFAQAPFISGPKTFEFGPGTPNTRSNMRTFSFDARTEIARVRGSFANGGSEKVFIDLHAPSADSVGSTGPDGPLVATFRSESVLPSGNFSFVIPTVADRTSEFGCPSTWRVRVRSAVTNPTEKVSGTIFIDFFKPIQAKLTLGAGAISIAPDSTSTSRSIGSGNGGYIDGSGTFRIKGKWHAETGIGVFAPVTVKLLRPNGTTAKTHTGYSQHAPANDFFGNPINRPKLDFTYAVSAADALLPGAWQIQVTNPHDFRIRDFNLTNTIDGDWDPDVPDFNSTFTASCAGGFELSPEDREAKVNQILDYAYTWIVPDPLSWNDLRWIQLRVRDGDATVMWLNFDVVTRNFSVLDEESGHFGLGYAAGSQNQLETNKAILHLAGTSFDAESPTSPIVTLNLQISLKTGTEGRALAIEVAAQENAEEAAEFPDMLTNAGTLSVEDPRPRQALLTKIEKLKKQIKKVKGTNRVKAKALANRLDSYLRQLRAL